MRVIHIPVKTEVTQRLRIKFVLYCPICALNLKIKRANFCRKVKCSMPILRASRSAVIAEQVAARVVVLNSTWLSQRGTNETQNCVLHMAEKKNGTICFQEEC